MLLAFVRDLAEETNNYPEALQVYEHFGKMYQTRFNYKIALLSSKKMLQIAWCEHDLEAETRAYSGIALQHFYMEDMHKAQFYKMKAFYGDLEGAGSLCSR